MIRQRHTRLKSKDRANIPNRPSTAAIDAMTEPADPYRLHNAWQSIDDALGEEVIDFWQRHGALPSADIARQRLAEIVLLARAGDETLAAVSSVKVRAHPGLGHKFYSFRCFVAPDHRRSLLAARLICGAFDFFDQKFRAGANPDVIGMIAEVENRVLNREHNQAIWPHSGFVFVGYDSAGRHVRVRYFQGARIVSRI